MNNLLSRRLRVEHLAPFFGDSDSDVELLLQFLNGSEGEHALVTRQLVKDMNHVDQVARKRDPEFEKLSLFNLQFNISAELRRNGLYSSTAKRMKRIRDAYEHFAIRAMPIFPVKSQWLFQRQSPSNPIPGPVSWVVLAAIHGLALERRLKLIRECPCGKWFEAYRPDEKYRFHSDACREKYWRSTSAGKKKRAAFMRKHREKLKIREQNLLRTADELHSKRKFKKV